MYAHLDGIIADMGVDSMVIDCGGVGYQLTCSAETLNSAPGLGERMKVYTYLAVREDAMELFGFYSKEEKRLFERLRSVSGVGSKSAMSILSSLGVLGLSLALAGGDAVAIAKAPGVGKKTAQRLVLELRDKVTEEDLVRSPAAASAGTGSKRKKAGESEAIEALMALGYGASEAAEAVSRVAGQAEEAGEITRLALKGMGR